MKLVNYTPHPINLLVNGEYKLIPSSGSARVNQRRVAIGDIQTDIGSVALTANHYGEITGLPEQEVGTWIIVSRIVMTSAPERNDLVAVNETVRSTDSGFVTGAKSLTRL